jgi:putative ABC transport system permease protein
VIGFSTALKLALSETRRARGSLSFCVLSIALGVLSITAIGSVTDSLRDSVEGQGQRLLGADLVLSGSAPLDAGPAAELIRDLTGSGARGATSVRFYSMLTRAKPQRGARATQLIRVRAVGDGFPFYGEMESLPAQQFQRLREHPAVLVDPSVARALGLGPGEHVRLGELELSVLGEFVKSPGSPGAEFSVAPYVFMHERYVAATGLLQAGARIQYEQAFALPEPRSAEAWKEAHWDRALDAHLNIRTSKEAAASVRRFLSRLSGFMTVVSLVTLFLGALGIGSAMHAFMASKLDHAAILRCVGATSRDLFAIYSFLSLGIATLGSALGALGGALVPLVMRPASQALGAGFLPTELVLGPTWNAILHGLGAGILSTSAFTLVPIWRTAAVAPLRVLGRAGDAHGPLGTRRRAAGVGLVGIGAAIVSVFVLSLAQTDSWRIGASFSVAMAVALGVLFGLARGIVGLARLVGPRLPSFHWRQGIANLHRPGNQTSAVIVALGMGFLLLGSLLILQRSMRDLLALEQRDELPNVFILDIQPEQQSSVAALIGAAEGLEFSPMIAARIGALNGRPLDTSHVQRDDVQRTWEDRMRTREYFLSYRSQPVPSESVTQGQFWSASPREQEASLEEGLAESLGVALGDLLTLDIQGLPLTARVTSFREIRWQTLRPNAMILLSPGEIEAAPKLYVASLRLPGAEARQSLQERLVAHHPNLTVIDAAEAAQTLLMIMSRVSIVFTVLGVLALLAGAIILGGAIAAGRFARQKEAMLFKVLGASRADLRQILGAEYATLAVFGTLSGWLLAEIMGRTALPRLFDAPASVPYASLSALALGALVLNTGMGLLVGRHVSTHTPLSILREE